MLERGRGTATRGYVSTLTHELQRNIRHMDTLNSSIKELVLALGLHSNWVKVNSQNSAGLITAMTVYTESNMELTQTLHSVAASVSTSVAPTIPQPSVPPQMIVPPITVSAGPVSPPPVPVLAAQPQVNQQAQPPMPQVQAPKHSRGGRWRRRQHVPPYHRREMPGPLAPRDDHQYRL